ncbi:MAG: efflux RND transporter permease subunit [Steroidobacteraceae bacterium]
MWIVRVALSRPYTFIALALLIILMGVFTILRTAVDIFPSIRIPVVASVWSYSGLPPEDVARKLVLSSERTAQTTVSNVEHTESQSLNGIGIIKYFFQPSVNIDLAYTQITGISQTLIRGAPSGTTPPLVLAYDASSVPVIQLALSSNSMSESQIFDTANNIIRLGISSIPGASSPFPYGGKQRQIMVDLDPQALRGHNLSALDVSNAISSQNLILPAGVQKVGDLEYYVRLNSSLTNPEDFNSLPVRTADGVTTYVRDVAHVRDGSPPQTNIVRLNGQRAVLMSIMKTGDASTLDVIDGVQAKLPQIKSTLSDSLSINTFSDQSVFVRAAVQGVIREGVIAAALTALMILLFLGNWRSTLIIAVSIPLSVLAAIITLAALGETINIMTLGGLALAVGILVDDATVTIENINWHLEQGKEVEESILEGARQIAVPALVSTLAICIVFLPMLFLDGIARYLFVPMAEAVVFAMLASYLLSRTLVPTLAKYWLRRHEAHTAQAAPAGFLRRFQQEFERRFEALRERYRALLERAVGNGGRFALLVLAGAAASALLAFPIGPLPGLGQDFFPSVDAGEIKLHLRARAGTRIEATASLCDQVEALVREIIPAQELSGIADNIGLPYSGINLAYSTSAPIGPADADIFISLKEGHGPTAAYTTRLREQLRQRFPDTTFAFLPADIVNQILNFGMPAPIDVQIAGSNVNANRRYAYALLQKLRNVPGAVDVRMQQASDAPQLNVDVNRSLAQRLGLSQTNVATNLLVTLSGSFQTSPSFWIDPKTGSSYSVATQAPQYRLDSLADLQTVPITAGSGGSQQLLANLATFRRSAGPAVVSHYNAANVIDLYLSVQNTDLAQVAKGVDAAIASLQAGLPKGSSVAVRGQVQTMKSSFNGLLLGLAGAVILVYLLIVVNFQSWLDPFIIIAGLPAALAGIVWMLFLTGTTVSVPVLTGAIMCMGLATANSILVVSFARERMRAGDDATQAAIAAGYGRLRPVLMTALAMIIGMLPMALGLGEGGEQNAPLGRAVIGGLIFATAATLFLVPAVFALLHGKKLEPGMFVPSSARGVSLTSLLIVLVVLIVAAGGIWLRMSARAALANETRTNATPVVRVTQPGAGGQSEDLVLPATLQAYSDAPIYARTSGYLKRWLVDIGARVKKGQLIAEIETPEVDQELRQAEADRATAAAESQLAQTTADRYQSLLKTGTVARQDVDEKVGDAAAKLAALHSADANLAKLREEESFKNILAPFDGIITARRTDVGALVTAGSSSSATELFHIASNGDLRAYVNVPQLYAASVRQGQQASVVPVNGQQRGYPAHVVSTADAIDTTSGTLLTQLAVDNRNGELLPGAYAEVHFKLAQAADILRVPANALLYRGDGLSVVVVGADNKLVIKPITPGRDFGTEVEVLSGIQKGDRLVLNPPESSTAGTMVSIAK